MTWQNWAAASTGLLLTALFVWALVIMWRSDRQWNRKAQADLTNLRAMIDALPKPNKKADS